MNTPRHLIAVSILFLTLVLLSISSQASPPITTTISSGSLQWSGDKQWIYSANLWQGSISKLPADINKRPTDITNSTHAQPNELILGQDIRRIAINSRQSELLATDYLGNEVILVDTKNWTIKQRISTGKRPFGAIYQASHNRYWVSLFEDHQIIAIQDGQIVATINTEDTPRGLALTSDNRLLVTHSMTGQLSIYSVDSIPTEANKVITLNINQHNDEFVSQGLPRELDDIAISPDEKEAWLPHVLWNFDHEFQFQSTVFPAVSVIDLVTETERVDQRKELFRTINIVDNKNRTRIVSNPHDAEFSDSGKKLYITLAGSDDLLVFDRSRVGKSNKKRHRRKKHSGGVKATQVYRHTPGQNPRGLLLKDSLLWIQQSIPQTLALFDRGGDNAFDRVSLVEPSWAQLADITSSENINKGRAFFHSANTDLNPEHPIAGDFWMSCNSCHQDGFNFTNRYLMEAYGQDKHQDARAGHPGLSNMVSGDFVTDYLNIIQKTQGGMGEDDRDSALPLKASEAMGTIMGDMMNLHQFVTLPHNLPFLATWLKLDGEHRTHPKAWTNSAQCAECHQEIFDQWADSNHRLMGESNPYFIAVLNAAGQAEGEDFKDWCLGCHMPSNVMSNLPLKSKGHMFEKNGASLKRALENNQSDIDEGTSCLFCHRITDIEDAGGNASFTINLIDREHYVGEKNTDSTVMHWLSSRQINSKPKRHKDSYMKSFYTDPKLCKTCHNEFAPGTGALIVDTYGEWEKSSFNNPGDPSKHRTCIDCHMHGDIDRIGEDIPGLSTDRGTPKKNVVTHQFTGANHHLVGLRNKKLEAMSLQLLRSSATVEQRFESAQLIVKITNVGAGHDLPTGVADFRQFWIEVTATDADNNIVLSSGYTDDKGNIEENARLFMKVLGDTEGKPVGLLFWRYAQLLSDTRIPADGYREERFSLPSNTIYPVTVKTRLLYRIYPQWVTDAVQAGQPDLPTPPIVELLSVESQFSP